jgi:hypothetical protein
MAKTISKQAAKAIKKFLYYFPRGFTDKKYIDWERDYKWNAHLSWNELLNQSEFRRLLRNSEFEEIAKRAISLESKTNLLFSFEKMAVRDAVKSDDGAKAFATGLFDYVYGKAEMKTRFEKFKEILSLLPRKQTRVLTWPLQTVFGFIADPVHQIFLKPRVTQEAARKYGFEFIYRSKPNWETYENLHGFAERIRKDAASLKPKDLIDIQSFIWVQGSDEYPD